MAFLFPISQSEECWRKIFFSISLGLSSRAHKLIEDKLSNLLSSQKGGDRYEFNRKRGPGFPWEERVLLFFWVLIDSLLLGWKDPHREITRGCFGGEPRMVC